MSAEMTINGCGKLNENTEAVRSQPGGGRRSFSSIWAKRSSANPGLLEKVLDPNNLNQAWRKVRKNKGAPGVDGITIEKAPEYLKKHKGKWLKDIKSGHYTPSPVRRVVIPKSDGGTRNLGIPTVEDRVLQQAVAQQIGYILDRTFSDSSYAYRPGRSAKDAVYRVRDYVEQGYQYAVLLDLSKFFDTLDHEILLNLLRESIDDERIIQLIKRFVKSGVLEGDEFNPTKKGSTQGSPISPLLGNVYLNVFDQEMNRRGVICVRYADDICLLARSRRSAERIMESSTKLLEGKLRLTVNREKSRVVKVNSQNFKYLGFRFDLNKGKAIIRIHDKSWKKMVTKVREITSRSRCGNIVAMMERLAEYMRGWLNYYRIAEMSTKIGQLDQWVRRRIRMCIWKQWKRPATRLRKLIGLGVDKQEARKLAYSRKGYWACSLTKQMHLALNNKRFVKWGYYEIATHYESMHDNC